MFSTIPDPKLDRLIWFAAVGVVAVIILIVLAVWWVTKHIAIV